MAEQIPEPRAEVLDFILEFTEDAPERQLQDVEALNTKMTQLFGAASVVIGLSGISSRVIAGNLIVLILLVGALVCYIFVAGCAIFQLWPRSFRRSLQADVLWPEYWNSELHVIKHALVQDISEAYEGNKRLLVVKTRTLVVGLIGLSLQVIFVASAIIAAHLA